MTTKAESLQAAGERLAAAHHLLYFGPLEEAVQAALTRTGPDEATVRALIIAKRAAAASRVAS